MPAAKGSVPWNAGTSNGWTDKRGYRWLYVTENGKRRARRSMEAFALLREELKAERALKAELLEALQVMVRDYSAAHASCGDLEMSPALFQAQRAIARATGEQP